MPRLARATQALARHGPTILVVLGLGKAGAVLWIAPRLGAPVGLAMTAAVLWVAGPALAALWLRRRARPIEAPPADGATPAGDAN